jgi:tetratricopeptide (TPR) repeat protein
MSNKEKIIELLQKDGLSEEDQIILKELIRDDKEAAEFYDFYRKINAGIKSSSHLSFEELSDYILYKNGLEPEDRAIIKSIPQIEGHLRSCPVCNDEFKNLSGEFNNIETFVSSELKKGEEKTGTSSITFIKRSNVSRYAFLSILFLGLIYGAMFTISKITTPKYYALASVNKESDFYATRGRVTDDFIKSLNALDEGNIPEAINFLKSDIKNNPADKTIFYSYYILGLTYLDNAKHSFIGLFPQYNDYYAKQALLNFQTAIQKNDTGNYRNITLDAYFYCAKANLMLGNLDDTKNELMSVIKEKGSKMDEAKRMLKELE